MTARTPLASIFSVESRSHVVIVALKVLYKICRLGRQDLLIALTTVGRGILHCCQFVTQAPMKVLHWTKC